MAGKKLVTAHPYNIVTGKRETLLEGLVGCDDAVLLIYQQKRLLMSVNDGLNRKRCFSHVFLNAFKKWDDVRYLRVKYTLMRLFLNETY
jgi:hypothetical protein